MMKVFFNYFWFLNWVFANFFDGVAAFLIFLKQITCPLDKVRPEFKPCVCKGVFS